MIVYPNDAFERLEFNKVLKLLEAECLGEEAKHHIRQLPIETDKEVIQTLLDEVDEWKKAIERNEPIPLSNYESITADVNLLRKIDYVLDVEAIQRLHAIIVNAYQLFITFQDYNKHKIMPLLTAIVQQIVIDKKLIAEIERVFDEQGEVRPNASENLLKISKAIVNKEREADKVFKQELVFYKEKGYLVDSLESIRNGRRVLAVAVENKRRIEGVVHDESATGKSVYIEPDKTISINNEVYSLYSERRAEIYRIIKDLCTFLRPYADEMLTASLVIIRLDGIRAKARLAMTLDAKKPKLHQKPRFDFKEAYNPILLLKQKGTDKATIPFTLGLHGNNHLMVLSGPNAGGKSVTMKTVGLLQLMLQAGMLIPVDENSNFGIFDKILVDIGDQQSLEDDLSTYSSHLKNMKKLLDEADQKTLVLIDEFGAGTDPKIGGAIAESILHELLKRKSFGVITTHYSNLKFYAYKAHGIVNASMEFDKAHLTPTFQLIVGKPGSSFAFEIAHKTGFPDKIIEYAKTKAGKNEKAVEELLVELQAERKEIEDKMAVMLDKEERLDKLVKTYEQLHQELEYRRKKVKLDQKEAMMFKASETQREVQKLVKELKDKQNLEKAMAVLEVQKTEQQQIINEVKVIKHDLVTKPSGPAREVKLGGFARLRNGDTIGRIVKIDKSVAELEMGIMTIRVPIADLVGTQEPIETKAHKSVNTSQVMSYGNFETKLDLRGYRVEEALPFLEEFIEKALVNSAFELRIVHGVGNGIMRKNVHKKLKEYKEIKEYWHPEENLGGEGVTYVRL